MKNIQIYEFLNTESTLNNIKVNKIKCAIFRNKKNCLAEKEILDELIKSSDEFNEFEKERNKINTLFSGGKTKMMDGKEVHDIPVESLSTHQEQMKVLMDENKEIIDEQTKKIADFNKLLEEDTSPELRITKIKIDDCEELTYEQMKIIDFMLED